MSLATNMIILMLCINLFLYFGYKADMNGACFSNGFLVFAKFAGDENISWGDILSSYSQTALQTLAIVGALIGLMYVLSLLTGSISVGLTVGGGGSGFGAVHALTIAAIIIFMNFVAMPDITCLGLPTINGFGIIDFLLRIILGGFVVVSMFGLLRGE